MGKNAQRRRRAKMMMPPKRNGPGVVRPLKSPRNRRLRPRSPQKGVYV